MTQITKDSLISLGLVGTLIFAAFSFGVMYQRFTTVEVKVQAVERTLGELRVDFYRVYYPEKARNLQAQQAQSENPPKYLHP